MTYYELVCGSCGTINRQEVPLPSKKDGLDLSCYHCNILLITFYGDESLMGKVIKDVVDNLPKVVK